MKLNRVCMSVCTVSFILVSIIIPCFSNAAPSPDIKANNSDTEVAITTDSVLRGVM